MNSKLTFSIFCLLLSFSLLAQNGRPPIAGARAAGLGGVGVAFEDNHSVFANQAGMAWTDDLSVTLVGEQRFLLSSIRSVAAGAIIPSKAGHFGVNFHHLGSKAYSEQRVSLGYARKLMDNFSIGGSFVYLNTSIPDYGSKSVFTFELGLMARFSKQLNMGVHIFNPLKVNVISGENLPSILNLGLQYTPSDRVRIFAEVEKDIDFKLRTRWAVEYELVEHLNLRFGVATQSVEVSFGVGYQFKGGWIIDIASTYHETLGFTPTIGVIYLRSKS